MLLALRAYKLTNNINDNKYCALPRNNKNYEINIQVRIQMINSKCNCWQCQYNMPHDLGLF